MPRLSGWNFLDSDVDFLGHRLVSNSPRDRAGAMSGGAHDTPDEGDCGTGAGGFKAGNKCARGGGMRAGRDVEGEKLRSSMSEYAQGRISEIEQQRERIDRGPSGRPSADPTRGMGRTPYGLSPDELKRLEIQEKADAAEVERRKYVEKYREQAQLEEEYGAEKKAAARQKWLDTSFGQIAKDTAGVAGSAAQTLGGALNVGRKAFVRGMKFLYDRYGDMGSLATIGVVGGIAALTLGAPAFGPAFGAAKAASLGPAIASGLGTVGAKVGAVTGANAVATGAGFKAALAAGGMAGAAIGLVAAEARNLIKGMIAAGSGHRDVAEYEFKKGFVPGIENPNQKTRFLGYKVNKALVANAVPPGLAEDVYKMLIRLCQMMKVQPPDISVEMIETMLAEKYAELEEAGLGDGDEFQNPSIESVDREAAPMSAPDYDGTHEEDYFPRAKVRNERLCWGKPCHGGGGGSAYDKTIEHGQAAAAHEKEFHKARADQEDKWTDIFRRRKAIAERKAKAQEAAKEHFDKMYKEREKARRAWHTQNSQPSDSLDMSAEKACEIIRDGSVHGKKLTKAQKGMFGAKCGERTENEDNWEQYAFNARMCWGKPCPGAAGMPAAKPDSGGSGSVEASVDRAYAYAKARGQAHRQKGSPEPGYKELERRKRRLRYSDPRRTLNEDAGDGWVYL